jgi:hypothetical protein
MKTGCHCVQKSTRKPKSTQGAKRLDFFFALSIVEMKKTSTFAPERLFFLEPFRGFAWRGVEAMRTMVRMPGLAVLMLTMLSRLSTLTTARLSTLTARTERLLPCRKNKEKDLAPRRKINITKGAGSP